MNVLEKIIEVIKTLDEIDNYSNGLADKLSNVDSKICDLMHIIELNKLKTGQCYRVIRELHTLRNERRKIKNDMELLSVFKQQQNRLLGLENRQMLLSSVGKANKSLINSKYKNRVYTDEEITELLGE